MAAPVGAALALLALLTATGCGGATPNTADARHPAGQAHPDRQPRSRSNAPALIPAPAALPANCPDAPSGWSPRRLAAEVTTISVDAGDLRAAWPAVRAGAGGVVIFGDSGPADLGARIQQLERQAPAGPKPIIMADEEGGGVERIANLVGSLPWPRTAAKTLTPAALRRKVGRMAQRMQRLGITMDLAPVLDLDNGPGPNARHPDGRRSFSLNPAITTRYSLAFAQGLIDSRVIPVVKHFPGLGTATNNTDIGRAVIAPLARLERVDLAPFRATVNAGTPAVMMSNAVIRGFSRRPVSVLRRAVTGLLRRQLGFRGLIVTDSLTAGALRSAGYTPEHAAVAALRAGADLTLGGDLGTSFDRATFDATVRAVTAAVAARRLQMASLRAAATEVFRAEHGVRCLGTLR
jgi:beta-N-acetylhexosaminidase